MASSLHVRTRRILIGVVCGLTVGLVAGVAAFWRPAWVERAETFTYDPRVRAAAADRPGSSDIVVVDIGEGDLQLVAEQWDQSWPWRRSVYATLVDYLVAVRARAIAFDFVYNDSANQVGTDNADFATAMERSQRTVIGMLMPSVASPGAAKEPGALAMRVARYPGRASALQAAVSLQAFNYRTYLLPEEGTWGLWVGDLGRSSDAEEAWTRLRRHEEDLPLVFSGAREAVGARAPRVQALTAQQMAREVTIADLLRDRDTWVWNGEGGRRFPARQLVRPFAPLAAAATHVGNVLQLPDGDGLFRGQDLLVEHQDRLFPSLALAWWEAGHPGAAVRIEPAGLRLGDRLVPIDRRGRLPIRFVRYDSYHRVSSAQVLNAALALEAGEPPDLSGELFRDKYVIISASAPTLADMRSTPVSDNHLGALINANVLDNLLTGDFVRRASRWVDALACVLFALLLSVVVAAIWSLVPWGRVAGVGMVAAVVAGYGGLWHLGSVLLERRGYWVGLSLPMAAGVLGVGASVVGAVLMEQRGRRFVEEALGRYTSPVLVKELIDHPEYLSLEWGEVREISVYFSDIAGFTSFSEKLVPTRLVALLNDYLTHMTDIVLAHDGVVDKYIGDAIMAFWGAPLPEKEHAQKAVLAALAMRQKCEELRPGWERTYGTVLVSRAGVNTGTAISGNMGSRHKFNYTVMGDTVNLASRLEGANKAYGTTLMISESCCAKVRDVVEVRELDLLAVKGKQQAVAVFEVLAKKGRLEGPMVEGARLFGEAVTAYRAQRFVEASRLFEKVLELLPEDGPARTYLDRCRYFTDNPPGAAWDGVWRMTEK